MAANDAKFTVSILSEGGVLFYGDCDALFVPTEKDVVAILAHHTPMIAKLGPGDVIVKSGHSKTTVTTIQRGLLYVGDNQASVLANL